MKIKRAVSSNVGQSLLSYGGLVLCLIIFSILSKGKLWSAYNIGILIQGVCVYSIIALGAVFIYSMGYMDISVGAQVGVYGILMILIINRTDSVLAGFLAVFGLALVCGFINGYVAVLLGLPSIVTSIFLMSIFGGVQSLIMDTMGLNSVSVSKDISFFKQTPVMLAGILIILAVSVYLYCFTRLGFYVKCIGANEKATAGSGVNTTLWKVLAYAFFGLCIAVGSLFLVGRTGAAGSGTGTGYAMDIMVALLLGGMPLSGGMKSRVSSAVVGSLIYVILSNGLTLSGVDTKLVYLIKAIVFLVVILLTCRKKDGVLPR